MVAACIKTYGRIDVLDKIGIAEMGSVVEVSEAECNRVLRQPEVLLP